MSEPLSVALNRDRLHDIDVRERYAAGGPFVVELTNHGEAMHVHLHLDDRLSEVAELAANNHYVEEGDTVTVEVGANPRSEPLTGKLKVVTGYGAQTAYVDVTVEEHAPSKSPIEVDEDLARPQRRTQSTRNRSRNRNGSGLDGLREEYAGGTLAVAGVGVLLLLALLGVGLVVDGALVLVAVGMVVGALLVAAAVMLR
ncbi:hypothetical protein ACFO0N_01520 [Halobium salinum]|uniref:Uncharacterized protein n=1 Tax=Halobium salinum TaxID=1364940 RepID=A0ABD5P6U1_9EURY|nr:hypothetical protein [Halobium salinum]